MSDHTPCTTPPATTYVRHTVDRLSAETARPGHKLVFWDYVHLLNVIGELDAMGHGDLVREAADRAAAVYGLTAQSAHGDAAPGHRRLGGFGAVS